jgi:hypothetical protein
MGEDADGFNFGTNTQQKLLAWWQEHTTQHNETSLEQFNALLSSTGNN